MHSDRSRAIQHTDAKCPFTAALEPSSQHPPGHARHGGLIACCDPGWGRVSLCPAGFWDAPASGTWIWGAALRKRPFLAGQQLHPPRVLAALVNCWLLPLPSHLPPPAAPGTGWVTRQVMSVSSSSNVCRTENYPAKEKYRWFLFYCLSEGLAQGTGWKEVWWK